MKRLRCVCVCLILTICLLGGTIAGADTLSELQKKNNELKSQIKKAKDVLGETQSEKKSLLRDVAKLDAELDETSEALDMITEELLKTEALLEVTEEELNQATIDRETQYEAMRERILFMYEHGSVSYLEVLLSAEDIFDFLNRAEFIAKILEYDQNMASNLEKAEALVSEKLTQTNLQKVEISVLKAQQEKRMEQLTLQIEDKNKIILALTEDESGFSQQVSDLESQSAKIEKQIKEAQAEAERQARAAAAAKNAIKYSGGIMGWPVSGVYGVNDEYGWRTNPISRRKEFHTGLDLKASMGTSIVAAEAGRVISSGYNGGYGYTVVIDHGSGVSTLYAHNSKLLVSVGDTVKKGQTIARAGSSGYSTGPHLHFEVRINGAHTSPWKYLR